MCTSLDVHAAFKPVRTLRQILIRYNNWRSREEERGRAQDPTQEMQQDNVGTREEPLKLSRSRSGVKQ